MGVKTKSPPKACQRGHKGQWYQRPNGTFSCKVCLGAAQARFKARRLEIESSEPERSEERPPATRKSSSATEIARDYAADAMREQTRLLKRSKSERLRLNASQAILARAADGNGGKDTDFAEVTAEIVRRTAAMDALQNDPVFCGDTIVRMLKSGIIKLPPGFVLPDYAPMPVVELAQPESRLCLPEPEPAQIEEAVIVEPDPCFCGHYDHPGGSACSMCRCPLYVAAREGQPKPSLW